ncbi:MAG: hypothetical protein AAGA21_01440 [Pseudomonadota bacterium]
MKTPETISLPVLCLGAGLLLAGCTTDDPRKGGLFGGLFGLGSGAYAERVAGEEAALNAEEARYQDEVAESERLGAVVEGRSSQAADLKLQVASLRQDIERLDAEIDKLRLERNLTQDDVAAAEANVAALLGDIDRIEAEQEAIEQAKALGADADEETDPAQFGEPPREQVSDLRAYIIKLQDAVDGLKQARERRAAEAGASTQNID